MRPWASTVPQKPTTTKSTVLDTYTCFQIKWGRGDETVYEIHTDKNKETVSEIKGGRTFKILG